MYFSVADLFPTVKCTISTVYFHGKTQLLVTCNKSDQDPDPH
jgi:hypothetical protein